MYTSDMTQRERELFVKIAHRGASAYEPENTLRSFERAIEMKSDLIEFDLRSSQDGHIVIIHDKKVDRTTDGSGLVEQITLAELKELDAGKGEKIPTFEEVLELCGGKTKLVIELKENGIEEKVLSLLKKHGMLNDSFIVSFKPKRLKVVKILEPQVRTGLISFGSLNPVKVAEQCGADAVAPFHWFITDRTIQRAQESGLYLFTWVVDATRHARELKEKGVQGIVTNRPDII